MELIMDDILKIVIKQKIIDHKHPFLFNKYDFDHNIWN